MITSTSNQKVKQIVQWQNKAKKRKEDRVFLAEGLKMYEEAPYESILEVYLSQEAVPKLKESRILWEKLAKTGFEVVSEEVFGKMSDTQTPQGILTVLKRPEYQMKDFINVENPFLMILENLQDPGNLGTIIRTGEGAGITGVIMTNNTVDIFNPKTIRATMGSIYRVPFVYVEDLKSVIKDLHKNKICTYAAHLKGEKVYDEFCFQRPVAFLIGNEGNGLSKEVADLAENYLKIPMEGKVESLNAAAASAILMYEVQRQRRKERK